MRTPTIASRWDIFPSKASAWDDAAVLRSRGSLVREGRTGASCSHQVPQVGQVDVAVFVHLHHLDLHAGHLSAGGVGAVGRLGDETHLGWEG